MAGLALKAISYGAERIPDKLFDAIPGGYFRSQEEKEAKRRRKEDKKRGKRRAQSEGRGRRQRSPSLTESDYYSSDSYTDDSDYERRRRNRRNSDIGRGRDRGRDSDRDRKHRHHHHKDRSWSGDHDGPPYADRSISQGHTQGLHIPPPPIQPNVSATFPPAHLAGENYAHPQPYNAAHNHYAAKPYNPADYVPGAMHTPEYTNGQVAPINPQALAQVPAANQPPAAGYYGTQFPPPPHGSRSSRASSVDSRGLQSGPYIPHSNIQAVPIPNATAGSHGHSPYGARFPSATNTPPFSHTPPQYRPQNSSPYQPNYSPNYPVQPPHGYGSQPISRQGSIHSANAYGGQVGDSLRHHDRHRRHSIATNPDSRMPYRTPYRSGAGSSTTSMTNSLRGSVVEPFHEPVRELSNQNDGIDDHRRAFPYGVPEEDAGVIVEAASEGVNTAEALKQRHQARPGRRSHGRRRAVRSAPMDGYGSA